MLYLYMQIEKVIVGQLETNCYIVTDPSTEKCIIIDPGDNADVISERILTQNLEPTCIIATHGHFDHVLAASELQLAFKIPFHIHKQDEPLLDRMQESAQYWLKREIVEVPPKVTPIPNSIKFGKVVLTIIHTPGHSPGSIVLVNSGFQPTVFTGDTLFANGGVGRTDLPYSSPMDMSRSLKLLRDSYSDYAAYAGHEGDFIID